MIADFLTKPLQGKKFMRFRKIILGMYSFFNYLGNSNVLILSRLSPIEKQECQGIKKLNENFGSYSRFPKWQWGCESYLFQVGALSRNIIQNLEK